jgi:hypothetical protein
LPLPCFSRGCALPPASDSLSISCLATVLIKPSKQASGGELKFSRHGLHPIQYSLSFPNVHCTFCERCIRLQACVPSVPVHPAATKNTGIVSVSLLIEVCVGRARLNSARLCGKILSLPLSLASTRLSRDHHRSRSRHHPLISSPPVLYKGVRPSICLFINHWLRQKKADLREKHSHLQRRSTSIRPLNSTLTCRVREDARQVVPELISRAA